MRAGPKAAVDGPRCRSGPGREGPAVHADSTWSCRRARVCAEAAGSSPPFDGSADGPSCPTAGYSGAPRWTTTAVPVIVTMKSPSPKVPSNVQVIAADGTGAFLTSSKVNVPSLVTIVPEM